MTPKDETPDENSEEKEVLFPDEAEQFEGGDELPQLVEPIPGGSDGEADAEDEH